jgi:hypothetical protein
MNAEKCGGCNWGIRLRLEAFCAVNIATEGGCAGEDVGAPQRDKHHIICVYPWPSVVSFSEFDTTVRDR